MTDINEFALPIGDFGAELTKLRAENERLRAEKEEFLLILSEVSKCYMDLTGGLVSQPNTHASVVCDLTREEFEKNENEELRRQHKDDVLDALDDGRELEQLREKLRGYDAMFELSKTLDDTQAGLVTRALSVPFAGGEPPAYQTSGSAGCDLRAAHPAIIPRSGGFSLVLTDVAIAIPQGYEGQVRPRSGLARRGVFAILGTLDSDYRGIVGVNVLNLSSQDFEVRVGDRIAQLVIAPVCQAQFIKVDQLSTTDRGDKGFGSTGL